MIARWLIVGFVLWIAVSVAFRFAGQDLLQANTGGVAWLFMLLPLILFAVTYALLIMFKVDPSDRAEAASIFALPGLLLGIYEINSFRFVFPNLDIALGQQFAALMFASYAAVIICGIVSSRLQAIGAKA
ncbi:MAG: DUF5367 family protein [Pseudomonadota bacterium]